MVSDDINENPALNQNKHPILTRFIAFFYCLFGIGAAFILKNILIGGIILAVLGSIITYQQKIFIFVFGGAYLGVIKGTYARILGIIWLIFGIIISLLSFLATN